MATRAVPVVVERSPGGGGNWWTQVGQGPGRLVHGSAFIALNGVREELERLGATAHERGRALDLIIRELKVRRRVEVTAEISAKALRLAPLAPAEPSQSVSATVAAIVAGYALTESAEDDGRFHALTVIERRRVAGGESW